MFDTNGAKGYPVLAEIFPEAASKGALFAAIKAGKGMPYYAACARAKARMANGRKGGIQGQGALRLGCSPLSMAPGGPRTFFKMRFAYR